MTSLEKIESIIVAIGYYSTVETAYGISFEEVKNRSGVADKYCCISYEGFKVKTWYENSHVANFDEPMIVYFKTNKADTPTQQDNLITALSGVSFKDDFNKQHVTRVNDTMPLSDDTNHIWMQLSLDV